MIVHAQGEKRVLSSQKSFLHFHLIFLLLIPPLFCSCSSESVLKKAKKIKPHEEKLSKTRLFSIYSAWLPLYSNKLPLLKKKKFFISFACRKSEGENVAQSMDFQVFFIFLSVLFLIHCLKLTHLFDNISFIEELIF